MLGSTSGATCLTHAWFRLWQVVFGIVQAVAEAALARKRSATKRRELGFPHMGSSGSLFSLNSVWSDVYRDYIGAILG